MFPVTHPKKSSWLLNLTFYFTRQQDQKKQNTQDKHANIKRAYKIMMKSRTKLRFVDQ